METEMEPPVAMAFFMKVTAAAPDCFMGVTAVTLPTPLEAV